MDLDSLWYKYCDTDKPEDIFKEICPEDYMDDFDMFDYYETNGYEDYTNAIDKDFEDWYNKDYI